MTLPFHLTTPFPHYFISFSPFPEMTCGLVGGVFWFLLVFVFYISPSRGLVWVLVMTPGFTYFKIHIPGMIPYIPHQAWGNWCGETGPQRASFSAPAGWNFSGTSLCNPVFLIILDTSWWLVYGLFKMFSYKNIYLFIKLCQGGEWGWRLSGECVRRLRGNSVIR